MSSVIPDPPPASLVVDYPVDDMTITVRAEITASQLTAVLAPNRHQLPIDPLANEQTIRELINSDTSGPRQYGRGTLRDYVIGIEAVDGNNRRFHAGGRVVKNVAGYDLCRLLIGAQGRLGNVTQVTFKLSPQPPASELLAACFSSADQLNAALEKLNTSATTPVVLDVLNHAAATELCVPPLSDCLSTPTNLTATPAAFLFVGFEGPPEACRWQLSAISAELASTASHIHTFSAPDALARWCSIAQQHSVPSLQTRWLSRLTLLPSRVASAVETASSQNCVVFGRAGNGVLWISPTQNSDTAETAVLDPLKNLFPVNTGSLLVLRGTTSYNTPAAAPVALLSNALQATLAPTTDH